MEEQNSSRKLIVRIILSLVAVALLVGMVYSFTPALQMAQQEQGTPALKVNGETVTDVDIDRIRQSDQVLSAFSTGVLGDDAKILTLYRVIQDEVLKQQSNTISISKKEVDDQITAIREQNQLTERKAWSDALQRAGLTESKLREQIRERSRITKKMEEIQKAATLSDAEAQLYYDLHKEEFKSKPKVQARQISVSSKTKAEEILKQARAGADFAKLAEQNGAKNGGAVGEGKPVEALVFSNKVGPEVEKLTQPGYTPVIEEGKNFVVVKVEKVLPASVRSFSDAKNDVITKAKSIKQNGAVEDWIEKLTNSAKVEVVDARWKYNNPVVAKVGKHEVKYTQVLAALYGNQQVLSMLQQGGAQAEQYMNSFYKPQILESIVAQYVAKDLAEKTKKPFFGALSDVYGELNLYVSQDVKVTDADVQAYYTDPQNKAQFNISGSANLIEASFKTKSEALRFRDAFIKSGKDFTKEAGKAGATVNETGAITDTSTTVNPLYIQAIFKAQRLTNAASGSVSDIVENNKKFTLLYVSDVVQPRVKPLAEVRSDIEATVLTTKRNQAGQAYIAKERAKMKVESKLTDVLKDQQARVDAAEKTTDTKTTDTKDSPTEEKK